MIKGLFWLLFFFSLGLLVITPFFTFSFLSISFFIGLLWIIFLIFFRKKILILIEMLKEKNYKFFSVSQELFNVLLIVYLSLLLFQEFDLLGFINVQYLLPFLVLSGIITVLFSKEKAQKTMTRFDEIFIWTLGFLGVFLIYVKTLSLGWLSYVISGIAGVLIVLMGYLLYDNSEEELVLYGNWKWGAGAGLFLVVLSLVLSYFFGLSMFRVVFGSVYVLFIPGLVLSYVFFRKESIDLLERIALSFALSITVIPLLVFYLNLIGMNISVVSVSLVILGVCLLGLGLLKFNVRFGHEVSH